MQTSHSPTPPTRWFSGLRRTEDRRLGGVAAGLAAFWQIDPLLVRVAFAAPFLASVLCWLSLPWMEVIVGGLAVAVLQLVMMVALGSALLYLACWIFVPGELAESPFRRLLDRRGFFGTIVKLIGLGALAGMGLVVLGVGQEFARATASYLVGPVGLLLVAGLIALVVWRDRGGDVAGLVRNVGSPGLGRSEDDGRAGAAWSAAAAPGARDGSPSTGDRTAPEAGPGWSGPTSTVVLDRRDAEPPHDLFAAPGGAEAVDTAAEPTGSGTHPTLAFAAPDPTAVLARDDVTQQPASHEPIGATMTDSVDRARAAAAAEAEARAAAEREEKRRRVEERRARRAAARAVRRERNRWGWAVAALTLIVAGVLVLADRAGATELGLIGIGLICLALLSAGVLAGAWFGSARWLVLPAFALAGVLGAAIVTVNTLEAAPQAPPVTYVPSADDLSSGATGSWRNAAVTVDLTAAADAQAEPDGGGFFGYLDLTVDRGTLTVLVPRGQRLTVTSEVLVGTNHLAPPRAHLGDVPVLSFGNEDVVGSGAGQPPIYLSLHVGIGELNVIEKDL